jgi:hypothetical protein
MGRNLYRCGKNLSGCRDMSIFVFKIEFNCFFEVLNGFFDCFSLACNIKLGAPGNIPFSFFLDNS